MNGQIRIFVKLFYLRIKSTMATIHLITYMLPQARVIISSIVEWSIFSKHRDS